MAETAIAMTYTDYLVLERQSPIKHEYVNGVAYAMAGGSPEHGRLAVRLGRFLGNALEGRPCDLFSSDVRVRIEQTGRSTYPDLSVVCGERKHASDNPDALTNPIVIVEILSESTEASDRGDKWAHYQRIASLREYVLVSQHTSRVEVFRREGDHWTYHERHAGQQIELASLGVAIAIDDVYRDPLAD